MNVFKMLDEFHEAYNAAKNAPKFTQALKDLRMTLIEEEAKEVAVELYDRPARHKKGVDRQKLTKELADLLYVTIGTATTFGLPLEQVFREVHKSNMSKLGEDGKPILREDGKVLKGPNYREPDIAPFFE